VLGALLLAVSVATVWATANTPPHFTSLTASASTIHVGQTVTLTGQFTDPDAADLHTVRVHWGDDEPREKAEQIQLPAGQHTFQMTHTYTAVLAPTTIAVSLYDRQNPPGSNDNSEGAGKAFQRLPIQVLSNNVAPSFVDSSIKVTKDLDQPGFVTVEGDWVDPDPDPGVVTFMPGDGTASDVCVDSGRHFVCQHQYNPPEAIVRYFYRFQVHVSDTHGGTDTYRGLVRFP
jgi:hypothetical protein